MHIQVKSFRSHLIIVSRIVYKFYFQNEFDPHFQVVLHVKSQGVFHFICQKSRHLHITKVLFIVNHPNYFVFLESLKAKYPPNVFYWFLIYRATYWRGPSPERSENIYISVWDPGDQWSAPAECSNTWQAGASLRLWVQSEQPTFLTVTINSTLSQCTDLLKSWQLLR